MLRPPSVFGASTSTGGLVRSRSAISASRDPGTTSDASTSGSCGTNGTKPATMLVNTYLDAASRLHAT